MTVLSKLGNPVAAAASTALTAALIVAVNTTRKRRRQGGPDIVPTDVSLARPGGRGGTRPNRKPPSPRYKGKSGKQAWLLKHDKTQFYHDYIEHVHLARDPTSVLGKAFKAKFRISYAMFERILRDTRNSGQFPDDEAPKPGQPPKPLAMLVMGALRRLALGIPVNGLEDMLGISQAVLDKFIPKWENWFVTNYFADTIKNLCA